MRRWGSRPTKTGSVRGALLDFDEKLWRLALGFLGAIKPTFYNEKKWGDALWGRISRRKLTGSADFLSGGGMNEKWREWYVKQGVFAHRALVRYAFPKELAKTLPRPYDVLLGWALKREGERCHPNTAAVLAQHRGDFEKSVTQLNAAASREPSWLVNRMLNGMLPCYMRLVDGDAHAYEVTFGWDGVALRPGSPYVLPNVTARLEVEQPGTPQEQATLARIDFTYAEGAGGRPAASVRVPMSGPNASPRWMIERARWAFCSTYLLAAEIDRHIVMGHLTTELVDVALHESLVSLDNPVRRLLEPRTELVDVANLNGNLLVWGETGVMVLGSALSADSLRERFATRLGALDWKGFVPNSKSLTRGHYAPTAQGVFWAELVAYVKEAFTDLQVDRIFPALPANPTAVESAHHQEIVAFCNGVLRMSVVHQPFDGVPRERWFDASELAFKPAGSPALSLGGDLRRSGAVLLLRHLLCNARARVGQRATV